MIKVENLTYSFPQKDLYNEISFTLEQGQHCAFIGSSGSGKSTLVDILRDPENFVFDGTLEISPECRIGFVSQFSPREQAGEMTVFEYVGEKFLKLQKEMTTLCTEMETATELEDLLEKYQQVLDQFDAIGGNDFESNIDKKLNLANLGSCEQRKLSELSGGEFKLIQVIKEMLLNPELMIMDEPDVFLDFENLNALKDLINAHKGTLLVITHNRYLLNHCFNKIIHLENMELQEFDGRYVDYNFNLLESKVELQELAVADAEEMARNEVVIERLRDIASYNTEAARGKALYARVKIQERLEARQIKAPFVDIKQPNIQFSTDQVLEDEILLKVSDYSLSFDELLLEHVNFELKSKEKVALIGPNGTGKTTLLREIYQKNHPGIEIHEGAEVAYLSQVQGEMLNESNTILREFLDCGFDRNQDVFDYLSEYGFEEERMEQKIGLLSGGEKNILQIAKVCAGNANLLLLDEPTSHLDTYAQIALEKALQNYNGAILMVSHDYYNIANCMDYVLIIEDKTLRKMSLRKFRKMIYEHHFDKDYLEKEQKKLELESRIAWALNESNFTLAKELTEELEALIATL